MGRQLVYAFGLRARTQVAGIFLNTFLAIQTEWLLDLVFNNKKYVTIQPPDYRAWNASVRHIYAGKNLI